MTADEITLTLPGRRDFYRIAHLVLGGLAVRLDLTYEQLEDLQLALASVLGEQEPDGELSVTLRVEEGAILAVVGPFAGSRLREAIEEADGEHLDLRRLLETICDRVSVEERDGAEWVELTTYATPNIIGEIKRHFRDKGWSVRVPRGLQELNVRISRLIERLTVELGRSPKIGELAEAAGVTEEEVLEALESSRAYTSLSLSGGGGDDDDDLDPLESIGTEEHMYEVSEDRAVLEPGWRVLDEREQRILHLRFFEGLTQSQIAQQVGISQMHVSRLIRRSLEKLRQEIATEEPAKRRAS